MNGLKSLSGSHWWRTVATFAVLAVLCALAFLKYIAWGDLYGAIVGLPSRASEAQMAGHKAQLFFWAFVVLEGLATLVIASLIQLAAVWSNAVRLVARYGIALMLSLLVTGAVVGVLVAVGSRLRP